MADMIVDVGVNTTDAEKKLLDFQKKATGKDVEYDIDVNTDKAKKDLKNFEKETATIGSKIKSTFSSALDGIGFGAGLLAVQNVLGGVANAATQAFNSYKEFDSQVQNIATLGVVEDLNGLKNILNEVSKTTVDDGSVLAGATYQALSAGVKGSNEELGKFVQTASKVATAGGSDATTAVDGLTTVMNAFKISTADAGMVSDQFFGTIKAGKTTFPELAGSLSNVAGAAASAGISFGEVGASIATLTAQGIPTATATTQIRQAIVALQKPNADTAKLFKQMGLSVNDVASILKKPVSEGGGLTNFLNQLGSEAEKSGKSFTQLFGSVEASSAALALTGENATLAFSNLDDVINNSAGSAEFAYAEASKSIENQIGLIKGSIQAFFNDIFIALEPFVKGFLSGFAIVFDFVAKVLKEVAGAVSNFGSILLSIATNIINSPFGILISNAFLQIKDAILSVIPTFDTLDDTFDDLRTTINDYLPLIAGLVASIGAYAIAINLATIKTIAMEVITKGLAISQGIYNGVVSIGSAVVGALSTALTFLASGQVIATAKTYLFTAAQWLLNIALKASPIGLMVSAIGALVAGLIYAYKSSEDFRKILQNLYEKAIKPLVDALFDGAKAVLKFFGLLSDDAPLKETTKDVEDLNKALDDTSKGAKGAKDLEDLNKTLDDTSKVAKEVSLTDLINDLTKLKIAGKENTTQFTNLQNRIIKLNAEEQKFNDTLKQLKIDLGIDKQADEFSKSISKIGTEYNKLNADLQDKDLLNSFSNDLNSAVVGIESQVKPIELSNIIVGNEGIGKSVLNDIFGLDMGLLNTDVDLIKQKAEELKQLSSEISNKRLEIIANERDKQIALRTQQYEREKEARKKSFEEELLAKGFNDEQIKNLTEEFQNNELIKLKLFELEKNGILSDSTQKEKDEIIKRNEELEKINQDAFAREQELRDKQQQSIKSVINTTSDIFSDFTTTLISDQKNIGKLLIKTAFDILDSLVNVYSAQILATALAQPDSVASFGATGVARAGILTVLMKTALAAAKASIGGLETGGFASEHKPAGKSDTILRWLNPNEFVMNERATKSISKEDLHYMNTYGSIPNNNKDLIKELRNAKLVNTEIMLNVRDNTGGKFKIERVYR